MLCQLVNTAYYIDEILVKSCLDTLHRTQNNGSVFGEKNGTKHVKGCFYAGRCPCSHVQKDPRLVQGEPSKLLGENSMTGELS